MEPRRSPYAVPLTELEGVRTSPEELVTVVPDPRVAAGDLTAPFVALDGCAGWDGDGD